MNVSFFRPVNTTRAALPHRMTPAKSMVAPVAHPSLGLRSIRSAQALSKLTLLEFDEPQHPWLQWNDWLGAMGWSDPKPQGFLHLNR